LLGVSSKQLGQPWFYCTVGSDTHRASADQALNRATSLQKKNPGKYGAPPKENQYLTESSQNFLATMGAEAVHDMRGRLSWISLSYTSQCSGY